MAVNPYVNKVIYGGATLIDLTSTTATASTIMSGFGAFGADGAWIDGTATGGGAGVVYQDENGYIVIDDAEPYDRTISITSNGTYNVAGYGTASVSVAGASPVLETVTKTYTPSTTAVTDTITAGAGYDAIGEVDVTVSAVPLGDLGTPTNTTSVVGNQLQLIKTFPSFSAGYFSVMGNMVMTMNLVSSTVTPTETAQTVTPTNYWSFYSQVTVNAISNTYVGTGITRRTSSDLSASTLTVTAPSGYYSSAASKTLSDANLVADNIKSGVSIFGVTGSYEGNGGSDVSIDTTGQTSVTSTQLVFSGLKGEPTSFSIMIDDTVTPSATAQIAAVVYDGTDIHTQTITKTNNAQVSYASTGVSYSYNNGTLTVTSTSAIFVSTDYYVTYSYNGAAGNVQTADVQVGSGATSITFTGLEDEPLCWSCIFKSNFSTSSGYQRVIFVRGDSSVEGLEMDSAAHSTTHWTASYSGGSLTITSNGTNQGGYFHQPGYYQLTYVISGDQTLQTKTVTPTTSTQNVTADTAQGYTALRKVVVNPIPSSYVQPTTTVGATTYRASTASQTISSGTYHSAAATIAAVTQTNLSADNIKSGTTISISNGQTNLWSVTGTYTGGGGGGSMNVQTNQTTSRTTSTTLTSVNSLTCSTTGTYDVYWTCTRSSTSGTWSSRLYVGGTASGSEQTTWSNHVQTVKLTGVSISANQTVAVYVKSRGNNYYGYAPQLTIVQTA